MPLSPLELATRYRDTSIEEIAAAREWFRNYDGPKGAHCDPQTGCFAARIGFNVPSGQGARGITIAVESYRESDTVFGLYLIATGQTRQ